LDYYDLELPPYQSKEPGGPADLSDRGQKPNMNKRRRRRRRRRNCPSYVPQRIDRKGEGKVGNSCLA
jgi:hypothetical protein